MRKAAGAALPPRGSRSWLCRSPVLVFENLVRDRVSQIRSMLTRAATALRPKCQFLLEGPLCFLGTHQRRSELICGERFCRCHCSCYKLRQPDFRFPQCLCGLLRCYGLSATFSVGTRLDFVYAVVSTGSPTS